MKFGAAQGLFLFASKKLGYDCYGIEPSAIAIETSNKLKNHFGAKINIKKGVGENIPYHSENFDIVIGLSVFEHVTDIKKVFKEVSRVLKLNGLLYFVSTSALCPKQGEIRFFPMFSWYPKIIKRKIINWAMENKPGLIGYTDTPAINWFTPWMVKRLATQAGFTKIINHWGLIDHDSLNYRSKLLLLKLINSNKIFQLLADIFKPGCSYLLIKEY